MALTQPTSTPHRITVCDIAAAAGVARTTVSSALSGSGRVSDEQRDRIRQIAKELGYQPKMAAQLLRARSTGHIGLLLPDPVDRMPSETGHSGPILSHFVRLCEIRDIPYHIEFIMPAEPGAFEPPRALNGGLVDGVLVGGFVSNEVRTWLQDKGYSWVSVDEPADFSVLSAGDEGIYQATQKLVALGHRRIAYAGGPDCYVTHRLGLDGFRRAVQEFQLPIDASRMVHAFKDGSRQELLHAAANWARELLSGPDAPTAVICHGAVLARGIMYQAMMAGISIPAQLSVVALAVEAEAERALPCLSTVEVDFAALVEQAMDMLLRRISGKQKELETRRILPRLVMRETIAPPERKTFLG